MPVFDYEVELLNHVDALRALFRGLYVFVDTPNVRMRGFLRAAFRRADQLADGLAPRLTTQARQAVLAGKPYDASRWNWLGIAGALGRELLQEAGEERLEAARRAAAAAAAAGSSGGVPASSPPAPVPPPPSPAAPRGEPIVIDGEVVPPEADEAPKAD